MNSIKPTHRGTYIGRHSDLKHGAIYDIEEYQGYYMVVATSGRALRTPVQRWENVHELNQIVVKPFTISPKGTIFGGSSPDANKGFFDDLMSGGGGDNPFFIMDEDKIPEVKPNAPAYKHQNATRRINEMFKDSPSTEQLRKYRFDPEKDYD